MNDYRDNDPNFDPNLANASSRRGSTSTQSTSAERRFQDGSSRSSGSRQPSYDDAKSLKRQLLVANEKLKGHDLLAADYEQQLLTLAAQFKRANDARIIAVREAAIAKEELGLYKIQLEHANQEIQRAQKLLDKVEDERYEAEKAAAESRALARRYHRDLLMIKAMEEGRKIGMREGIEQGRALALRETGEHSDVNEADYADDYFDYTDNGADYPRRSRSLLLPSNEEIVVHPPRSPTPPDAPPPPPPQPIPVPPPDLVQPVPSTRPLSFRSASPSVYHQQVSIPPDGYIPVVDADNIIRMPPPHELARPPPTPERPSSPQLSQIAPEEPRPTPRSRARRQSTASFTSTSTFSNMAGPSGRNAPLCAIEEVQTPHASPLPQPVDDRPLRHQPSRASTRHSHNPEQQRGRSPQPVITRPPSANSNASRSIRPSSTVQDDRRSTTSSSAMNINIVPPSRPLSSATLQSQRANANEGGSRPTSVVQQLFGDRPFGQIAPSEPGSAEGPPASPHLTPRALPILMPGGYRGQPEQETPIRERPRSRGGSSTGRRPMEDDMMSFRSGDTLTTPQMGRRGGGYQRNSSLDSLASPTLANRSASGWEDAVRQAGTPVPVPFNS